MRASLGRLVVFVLLLSCGGAFAETITVFAAASLKEALDAAVKPFESTTGHKVVVSYGASGALARQVEAGAPAAIFLSADLEWIDYVESRALAIEGTRVSLLGNALVLIAPARSATTLKIVPGFDLAAALAGGRLAIANPISVPAGRYAKAALVSLRAWQSVEMRIAPTENVRAALALVSRGEAPLGIVYRTDALAEKNVRILDTFPAASHPPITYGLILLRNAGPAARQLAAHLASPGARAAWERFGFQPLR